MKHRLIVSFCLILLCNFTLSAQTATPTSQPFQWRSKPAYLSDLEAGDLLQVRTIEGDNLRVRTEPNPRAEMIINLSDDVIVTYLDVVSIDLYDEQGHVSGVEYWYKIRLGRPSDPDFETATEGWALGSRNGINFLIPAPKLVDPSYTPPPPCSNAPKQRLINGEMARVLPDAITSIYESPTNPTLVVELAGLEIFTVISEPVCGFADNYAWQVEYEDFTGWVLETDSDADYRYLVEPIVPSDETEEDEITEVLVCPDDLPSQLAVGMMTQADQTLTDPLNVRTRPTISGIDAFLLFPAEYADILNGPLCYGGTWWYIENERGVKGWVAETARGEYQLRPFDLSMIPPPPTIDAACIVTTFSGVNLRSGAGSGFETVGSAAAEASFGADAQALAEDGVVWWHLLTGEWVASNLTSESGSCTNLPVFAADEATTSADATPAPDSATQVTQVAPSTPTFTPTPSPSSGCMLTTLQGINLRATPSGEGEAIGSAAAAVDLFADGQFTDASGFRWWRLAQNQLDSGAWVRDDLVRETGTCTALPVIQAP